MRSRTLGSGDSASQSAARIELAQHKLQDAFAHLAESYAINLKLGRLDGICMVGLDLGQFLCMSGQREQGLAVLARSRDGFQKLGREREARQTLALLDRLSPPPPQPEPRAAKIAAAPGPP